MTSPSLMQEVPEAWWEEKIRKFHRWDQDQPLAFPARVHRHSQVAPGQLQVRVIADDPDDNAVLGYAKEGHAAHIVTGDGRLLSPEANQRNKVVPAVQFLGALTEHKD